MTDLRCLYLALRIFRPIKFPGFLDFKTSKIHVTGYNSMLFKKIFCFVDLLCDGKVCCLIMNITLYKVWAW